MINYYIALKKNFQNSLYETWLKKLLIVNCR